MGVFRFFPYLLNKYSRFYKTVKNNEQSTHYCDAFLIDLNAAIHPIAQDIYLNQIKGKPRYLNDNKDLTMAQIELKVFTAIGAKIVSLSHVANPAKVLYIAIDGVPGIAKQAQQRKRRFQNVSDYDEKVFDFKNITVGTKWMERLCSFILNFIDELHKNDPFFSKLDIIYNDMHVPGEGEHKIISWMDTDTKCKSYSIFSPDADLIMLSLGSRKKHLYVIRENIFDYIKGDVFIVNIDKLKQDVLNDIKWASVDYPYDEYRIIKDYVFLLILLGNDFLPGSPSITTKVIDKIQYLYSTTAVNVGYLINEDDTLNIEALLGFMIAISKIEPDLLIETLALKTFQPDTVLINNIKRTEIVVSINMETYSKDYYTRNFPGIDINTICYEYIKGMSFITQLYLKTIPTYDWFYPYHYAPLFSDIVKYLQNNKKQKYDFIYKPPLKLVECLASLLHPKSFYLLPQKINDFLTLRSHIDPDFSESFEVDYEGKQNDYEGIPLISTVPYDKIKLLLKEFKLRETQGSIHTFKGKYVKQPYVKREYVKQPYVKQPYVNREYIQPQQPIDDDDTVTITF